MDSGRWNPQLLESLRHVGDPVTDPIVEGIFSHRGNAGLAELNQFCQTWNAPAADLPPCPARDFFQARVQYPPWVDMAKLEHASRLFYSTAAETVVVLLLKSVPQAFVNQSVAKVFCRSEAFNPKTILRFSVEIAQLIFDVMHPGNLNVSPQKALGVIALEKLRMHHSIMRHYVRSNPRLPAWDPALGTPINQEDIAFVGWALAVYDLDGFQKLDLGLTAESEEATLMVWRVINFHLGLDERLQPANVAEAREFVDIVAKRYKLPFLAGTVMVRRMLVGLESLMPFFLKPLPVLIMRSLMSREAVGQLKVPRAHGWLWPSWVVFWFLRIFTREVNLQRRLLRMLFGKLLLGMNEAQARQGRRGVFRVPDEIARVHGYKPESAQAVTS